jgi:hypothetical protein
MCKYICEFNDFSMISLEKSCYQSAKNTVIVELYQLVNSRSSYTKQQPSP